jgi:hypothetical protein
MLLAGWRSLRVHDTADAALDRVWQESFLDVALGQDTHTERADQDAVWATVCGACRLGPALLAGEIDFVVWLRATFPLLHLPRFDS